MRLGEVPSEWKTANVTPIFKKGSPLSPLNYRPISLTCVCSKLFETGMKMVLVNYIHKNGLVSTTQHGFLEARSTTSNLLQSLHDWTSNLNNKQDTIIAYIDFAKAFDRVSIPKLLHKLSHIGITGNLFSCVRSLLTDRRQRVKINNSFSEYKDVTSGVPQGSVLGPVLFILFINDLIDVLPHQISAKLFADDLKAYMPLVDSNSLINFQSALDALSLWCETWQLPISVEKSCLMVISNKRVKFDYPPFMLSDHALQKLDEIKDLGVIMDNRLNFSSQITAVISKAKQRLYLLRKCFVACTVDKQIHGFKVYILPILDYCSPVWTSHCDKYDLKVSNDYLQSVYPGMKI